VVGLSLCYAAIMEQAANRAEAAAVDQYIFVAS